MEDKLCEEHPEKGEAKYEMQSYENSINHDRDLFRSFLQLACG